MKIWNTHKKQGRHYYEAVWRVPSKQYLYCHTKYFFSDVLPYITDGVELKATLFVFSIICRKKGRARFALFSEVVSFTGDKNKEALERALNAAVERGVLLKASAQSGRLGESTYFLNSEENKKIIKDLAEGKISLPEFPSFTPPVEKKKEEKDIFTLYEENIGLLSPIIIEELKNAEKRFPKKWVEEAFKEAVSLNKRNWKYIHRILENWLDEGKKDGAYRKDSKEDPSKYTKGKYGHMVNR